MKRYLVRKFTAVRRFLLLILICSTSLKALAENDSMANAALPVHISLAAPAPHYLQSNAYPAAKDRTPLSRLSEQQYANRLMLRGGILVVAAGTLAFITRNSFNNSGTQSGGQTFGAVAAGSTVIFAGAYGLFLLISGAYYDKQLHGGQPQQWNPSH